MKGEWMKGEWKKEEINLHLSSINLHQKNNIETISHERIGIGRRWPEGYVYQWRAGCF